MRRLHPELKGLRAYLAVEPLISDHVGWRANVRRIVAQLVSSQPMAAAGGCLPQCRAGASPGLSDRRGPDQRDPDAWRAARRDLPGRPGRATVADAGTAGPQRGGPGCQSLDRPLSTWTDELGNFMYDELDGGTFRLELSLPNEVIVVGELRLSRPLSRATCAAALRARPHRATRCAQDRVRTPANP